MKFDTTLIAPTIYFANLLGIVPICLLKAKKIKSQKAITPFLWMVFIFSLIEIGITIYFDIYSDSQYNSAYMFRIYTLFEFLTIYFYFKHVLSATYKLFLRATAIFFLLLYVYFIFIWNVDEASKTDSYLSLVETFFVLIAAFLWFKNNLEVNNKISLFSNPDFYYIFGFVFYFSTTIVLFLLTNYIQNKGYEEFWGFYIFNILFAIVWRILIIIGVWKARTK